MSIREWWFVFIAIMIGLVLVSAFIDLYLNKAYGEEYFWYYGQPWDKEPVVCIGQPINKTYAFQYLTKYQMISAINNWEEKLNNYTGTKNFNIKIFLPHTLDQLGRCNTSITFVSTIPDRTPHLADLVIVGQAGCITDKPKSCNILMAEKWFKQGKNPYGTLMHEFGHVLSLGHREGEDIDDKARVVMSFDVMIYQIGRYRVITDQDLEALVVIYGMDGWKEPNYKLENFTISR